MTNPELAPDMPEEIYLGPKYGHNDGSDLYSAATYSENLVADLVTKYIRADLAPQAGSVDVEGLRKELRKISDQTENSGGWHFVDKIIDHLASRNLLAGAPVGGDRPAIPGLQEAQGWQTVENVPRDQDVLVGYLNHAGEVEDVSVAYVSEGEKYHINSIYAEPRGDCRHCGGACKRVYVTHWMPLPAAPRDGRG